MWAGKAVGRALSSTAELPKPPGADKAARQGKTAKSKLRAATALGNVQPQGKQQSWGARPKIRVSAPLHSL